MSQASLARTAKPNQQAIQSEVRKTTRKALVSCPRPGPAGERRLCGPAGGQAGPSVRPSVGPAAGPSGTGEEAGARTPARAARHREASAPAHRGAARGRRRGLCRRDRALVPEVRGWGPRGARGPTSGRAAAGAGARALLPPNVPPARCPAPRAAVPPTRLGRQPESPPDRVEMHGC